MATRKYDLGEIRRCAADIRRVAESLQTRANRHMASIDHALYPEFRGKTADALKDVLVDLGGDIRGTVQGLGRIAAELSAFADRLEEADRKAKLLIRGKRI